VDVTSLKDIQESEVLHHSRIELTRKLHILEAHLLRYQSLLHNFKTSVSFIHATANRAMESEAFTEDQCMASNEVMEHECKNLLSEIDRLAKRKEMLRNRLKSVMNLAFATVNIEDSRQTRTLTQASVRDSAAMKQVSFFPRHRSPHQVLTHYCQISYLTMVFLPASFLDMSIMVCHTEPI